MNDTEIGVLEEVLSNENIDSEQMLCSIMLEELMQMHPIITNPDISPKFRANYESAGGRVEVMHRAYIAIIGYFVDIVHLAIEPAASAAYASFQYKKGGNQIEDLLKSSGVLERIKSNKNPG
jgi:hypothetical protein